MSKKPSGPRCPLTGMKGRKTGRQGDYEVGYGRPPKSGQFQPGHPAHPKGGRPKGAKNLATKVRAVLSRKIAVTENGKRRKIAADEAILHRYLERALSGDVKTGAFLLGLGEQHQVQEIGDAGEDLSARDEQIMRNFVARLGNAKKADTDDEGGFA